MKNYLVYVIALLTGASGVLAFSPFDLWGFAYVSLLGLLWVSKTRQNSTALWAAFLWGLSFFAIGVNWLNVSIHQFGEAPLAVSYLLVVVLAAYLSLYPLLFVYLIRRFRVKSAVIYPVLWTLTEFLRGWIMTGFPWLQFGYSQIDSPFAGIAPLFGVEGLTFFVMWVSASVLNLIGSLTTLPRKWNLAAANMLLIAVVGGLAAWSAQMNFVKPVPARALTVTLAQGNIEQNLKWDPAYLMQTLDIYQKLIAAHVGKSDLIVLPESALPALENELQPFYQYLHNEAKAQGTELLIGSVYHDDKTDKLFNSIVRMGNKEEQFVSARAERYNKHHLVPFGEYVPLENLLRPLGSVFNLPMSAFQSGAEIQPPLIGKERVFTPAICYEIILGSQLQKNLQPNTDFLLTVSNDAWFGNSIGPWQHLQMARMRALELGKPLIRATNTGITVFVDEKGKILAQAPQFEQTTLTRQIIPTEGKTPYAALGNNPLYLLALLLGVLHILGALIRRQVEKTLANKQR
ncbi:apolipoprotein N-acyltransferase [Pasteurellaceae bacterium LIM206]|nr:apolipoprotein N-acyltransferase [Pasteurellaceae bacterium LIM206]